MSSNRYAHELSETAFSLWYCLSRAIDCATATSCYHSIKLGIFNTVTLGVVW